MRSVVPYSDEGWSEVRKHVLGHWPLGDYQCAAFGFCAPAHDRIVVVEEDLEGCTPSDGSGHLTKLDPILPAGIYRIGHLEMVGGAFILDFVQDMERIRFHINACEMFESVIDWRVVLPINKEVAAQ